MRARGARPRRLDPTLLFRTENPGHGGQSVTGALCSVGIGKGAWCEYGTAIRGLSSLPQKVLPDPPNRGHSACRKPSHFRNVMAATGPFDCREKRKRTPGVLGAPGVLSARDPMLDLSWMSGHSIGLVARELRRAKALMDAGSNQCAPSQDRARKISW